MSCQPSPAWPVPPPVNDHRQPGGRRPLEIIAARLFQHYGPKDVGCCQ
ncbi:EspF repeat-containing protein [Janthinobacterium sp. GW458P]